MKRGGRGVSGGGWISLWAGRILGRGHGAAGGRGAQGAEGEDGGIVGVPGRRTTACQIPNLYSPRFPSTVLFQQHFLLHFLQVQTGPPQLPAVTVPILSVRCWLVEVSQNDGPYHWLHHLQLKAHGGWLEATWWTGAEEYRAGGGSQACTRLNQRPGRGSRWPAATEVPHLLITGGAAVVIAMALGKRRHPLPVFTAADSLKLFLWRVPIQIGI